VCVCVGVELETLHSIPSSPQHPPCVCHIVQEAAPSPLRSLRVSTARPPINTPLCSCSSEASLINYPWALSLPAPEPGSVSNSLPSSPTSRMIQCKNLETILSVSNSLSSLQAVSPHIHQPVSPHIHQAVSPPIPLEGSARS